MKNIVKLLSPKFLLFILLTTLRVSIFAHCDSYDGPVIKDAQQALETNNVNLVLKWIDPDQEEEITNLFNRTYNLKSGDSLTYSIVEKYFFETLVRLHRESEGEPFKGLQPAGTVSKIILLSDEAIKNDNINYLIDRLNSNLNKVIREKYEKVSVLNKVKNNSIEEGRAFVKAYVDYTHTIEAIHNILDHNVNHNVNE